MVFANLLLFSKIQYYTFLRGILYVLTIKIQPAGSSFAVAGGSAENRVLNFDLQNLWHYKTFLLFLPAWNQEVEPLMEIPEFDFLVYATTKSINSYSPFFIIPES